MPRLAHEALGNKIVKRIMSFRSIVLQQLKLKNLEPQRICKLLESVVFILKVFGKQAGWGIKCHALAHWQVLKNKDEALVLPCPECLFGSLLVGFLVVAQMYLIWNHGWNLRGGLREVKW